MSTPEFKADDLASAKAELLDLLLDESEKRIAAQVDVMLAADGRASGILGAAIALAAAAFALAAGELGDAGNQSLLWAAGSFGVTATLSASAAVWALWPKAIQVAGWSPRLFKNDTTKDLTQIKREMIALNQKKISENAICGSELAARVRASMCLLAAAPVICATFGLAASGSMKAMIAAAIILVLGIGLAGLAGWKTFGKKDQ